MPPTIIPSEIILEILEHAQTFDLRENRRNLLNFSLVSRSWAEQAQRLLFQEVEFKSGSPQNRSENGSKWQSFCAAVDPSTVKGRILGDAVRCLTYAVASVDGQLDFVHTLLRCPRLHELDLFIRGPVLDPCVIEALRNSVLPRIKVLRLDTDQFADLLPLWPTLEFLVLCPSSAPLPGHSSPTFRLSMFVSWDDTESLTWILGSSVGTLHTLILLEPPSPVVLEEILAAHGPHLRSLTLLTIKDECAPSIAEHCTHLLEYETLRLPSEAVLHALPPTLEHIAFQAPPDMHRNDLRLLPIVQFIRDHPKIRLITAHGLSIDSDIYVLILAVCQLKGVQVRLFDCNPRYSSPGFYNANLVHSHTIPREDDAGRVSRFIT